MPVANDKTPAERKRAGLIPGRKPGAKNKATRLKEKAMLGAVEKLAVAMEGLGAKALKVVGASLDSEEAAGPNQLKAAALVLDRLLPRLSQKTVDVNIDQAVEFTLDMRSPTLPTIELSDDEYAALLARAKCQP